MIGNSWTFWEYFFFGFKALGAGALYLVFEYWMQITVLVLIWIVIKFVKRVRSI